MPSCPCQSYFLSPARREVLLPSLLIATYYNPELLLAMEESVSGELIQQYLESYIAAKSSGGVLCSVMPCLNMSCSGVYSV